LKKIASFHKSVGHSFKHVSNTASYQYVFHVLLVLFSEGIYEC